MILYYGGKYNSCNRMDVIGHSLLMMFTNWFSISFVAFIR